MQAVQAAQATLDDFDTLPPLGQDAVSMGWRPGRRSRSWDSREQGWVDWSRAHAEAGFSFSQASKAWRKNKMDESKHEIHSQVDAITAGTASVVNLTAGRPGARSLVCRAGGEGRASVREHAQA